MRGFKRSPWLPGLGVLLTILAVSAGQARADASIDKKASVLVFPKLVANDAQDTLVQLTNTYTSDILVHCHYVQQNCSETDFDVRLTTQQPTFWRVSTGRGPGQFTEPPCHVGDPFCSCRIGNAGSLVCPGFDTWIGIGAPVPLPQPQFDGAMYCYEISLVDDSVIARNSIKGEAVIENLATGDISAYNAIGILGTSDDIGDTLDLNGSEFNACPNRLVLNHYGEGYAEPAFGTSPEVNASVSTELSLVPCTINLNFPTASQATVHFFAYDEFEQQLSANIRMGCVFRETLTQIDPFNFSAKRSATLATEIVGSGLINTGVLGVAIETHSVQKASGNETVSAAYNLVGVYEGDLRSDVIAPWNFSGFFPPEDP